MELGSTKPFDFEEACVRREELRRAGRMVVLTNGCFDLLHAGHLHSLENAKKFGDSLWVAVNSDASVKKLKGKDRPIFGEQVRAHMLSALAIVDGVFIFHALRLADEIFRFKPDIYVKSGDYDMGKLDPLERKALSQVGAQIHFVPILDGFSTTSIIEKIRQMENH
ncbi:MAG: adenylyltransferase/cytidyltransferase family protein [Puniceicoccales bacterium]|jgi:rfaE bifunctional protein nucleotidyltransferase chain/domain|nr:adenylyltransferase/cytidyltransferase family protein [Puniceicoccales bacterium]